MKHQLMWVNWVKPPTEKGGGCVRGCLPEAFPWPQVPKLFSGLGQKIEIIFMTRGVQAQTRYAWQIDFRGGFVYPV